MASTVSLDPTQKLEIRTRPLSPSEVAPSIAKANIHHSLKATKQLLSPDPSSLQPTTPPVSPPNFYYATSSAHLSQSDFGILFPWVIKKVFAVEDPNRIMRLNVRAVLQLLRNQKIEVSATSAADMELSDPASETKNDMLIFGKEKEIRGWNFLTVEDMDDVGDKKAESESSSVSEFQKDPADAVMGNEVLSKGDKPAVRL